MESVKDQLKAANELVKKLQRELETVSKIVEKEFKIGVPFKRAGSSNHYTLMDIPSRIKFECSNIKLYSLNSQAFIGNPFPSTRFNKDENGNVISIDFQTMQIITVNKAHQFEEVEYKDIKKK